MPQRMLSIVDLQIHSTKCYKRNKETGMAIYKT